MNSKFKHSLTRLMKTGKVGVPHPGSHAAERSGMRVKYSLIAMLTCLGQIFDQDFGLEVYFTPFHDYGGNMHWGAERGPGITVLAFLILASLHSALKLSSDIGAVSSLSSMTLDPILLQQPSPEEKGRFQKAMKTLQLTPKCYQQQLTALSPTSTKPATPKWRTSGGDIFSKEHHDELFGLHDEARGKY